VNSLLTQSAQQLVAEMSAGHLSAVELLHECRQRVEAVNGRLNALVVERWDEALEEARLADRAQQAGEKTGPLHGLPITIKEMFDVAGTPTTAGIRRRLTLPVQRDADSVMRLRQAGAIVIGKTNVPQMGMMAETDNPVYGQTNNPWNVERGPGGSSGGEAALIAAGASILGLGSDGGGSIRQPSHACGICGFKPTGGRLPMQGHWLSANWPADWAQPGPMARSVADLQLAFHVLCGRSDRRPVFGEVPLASHPANDDTLRKLRVGMYAEFAELPATPTVRRAVMRAAATLQECGVEIVPFRIEGADEMWDLFTKIFYAEGLRDMKRQMRGSPVDWRVRNYFQLTRLPGPVRRAADWIGRSLGQPRVAHTLRILPRPILKADQYCRLLAQVYGWRQHFARTLQRNRIDALLGPASPVPAFPHGEFYANYSLMYTGIYNLLALPAGVVPVTTVRGDELPTGRMPTEWVDRAMWQSQADSTGLPVGVQIIGPWWSDDQVLGLMRLLHEALSQSADFPHGPRAIA
jgi:fatty acid amide hydrolase